MNKIIFWISIILLFWAEVWSKKVTTDETSEDEDYEGNSKGRIQDNFIMEQCHYYGLSVREITSARMVNGGCSVECKYTYSKINVHKPMGHPCVPAKFNHSCYYGKCLKTGYTSPEDRVILDMRLLHSSIPMPKPKAVYLVALVDNYIVGTEKEKVLCMTNRIERSQLWWYHKCQSRKVSRDTFIRFELRKISSPIPLWEGEIKLSLINPLQGLFNVPMKLFRSGKAAKLRQRPTRWPEWRPFWSAGRIPGWTPDGILPGCASANGSLENASGLSEALQKIRKKPYLTITVFYRNETGRKSMEEEGEGYIGKQPIIIDLTSLKDRFKVDTNTPITDY